MDEGDPLNRKGEQGCSRLICPDAPLLNCFSPMVWVPRSASSVNRYINDLISGCRCVELDCW